MSKKSFILGPALLLVFAIAGCGGGTGATTQSSGGTPTPTPAPTANVNGDWEVAATSTQSPAPALPLTFVETNFTQASGSTSFSSVTNQTAIFSTNNSVTLALVGTCTGAIPSVSGTVNGSSISGTFSEGSEIVSFTGTLNSAGTSFTGTYQTQTVGSGCTSDQGTFVANQATSLSGSYSGSLTFSDLTVNTLALTVTTGNSNAVNAIGTITGPDAGTVTVNGTVIGNVANVTGTETFTNGSPNVSIHIYGWLHNGNLYIADVNASSILGFLTKQ
jgi:hypothetical protein